MKTTKEREVKKVEQCPVCGDSFHSQAVIIEAEKVDFSDCCVKPSKANMGVGGVECVKLFFHNRSSDGGVLGGIMEDSSSSGEVSLD